MKLISEFRSQDGALTAEIRFSMHKQIYYAHLSSGDISQFLTVDEAEDHCEDWVLGEPVYTQEGTVIDSGPVTLLAPKIDPK
jgi:hypothetical protein